MASSSISPAFCGLIKRRIRATNSNKYVLDFIISWMRLIYYGLFNWYIWRRNSRRYRVQKEFLFYKNKRSINGAFKTCLVLAHRFCDNFLALKWHNHKLVSNGIIKLQAVEYVLAAYTLYRERARDCCKWHCIMKTNHLLDRIKCSIKYIE